MKTELRFWSYLILSTIVGMMVTGVLMMLVVDVLIQLDVAVWTAISILGVGFIGIYALAFGCTAVAMIKGPVLVEGIIFKFRKNH